MTKKQKLQTEIAFKHIGQIFDTARKLRNRRNIDLGISLKIAKRYHRIYGFQE